MYLVPVFVHRGQEASEKSAEKTQDNNSIIRDASYRVNIRYNAELLSTLGPPSGWICLQSTQGHDFIFLFLSSLPVCKNATSVGVNSVDIESLAMRATPHTRPSRSTAAVA